MFVYVLTVPVLVAPGQFFIALCDFNPPTPCEVGRLRGQKLPPDFTEGGDYMVTYSELFQFIIMLTGIIALIYQVAKKK